MTPFRTAAVSAAACLAATLPVSGAERPYTDLGLQIPSAASGYTYAYAPAILRDGGRRLMIFCGSPLPGDGTLDALRISVDDGAGWSPPAVLLRPTDPVGERAACDPSLVRYRAPGDGRPWWYLFYSGFPADVGTAMFVARADRPEGPYAKWTGEGWEVDAPRPAPIVGPSRAVKDGSNVYGAGQQSVVVRDGRLLAWWTDDTGCPTSCFRVFVSETDDPTRWPGPEPTDLPVGTQSVDVKLAADGRYVLYAVDATHSAGSHLTRRFSADGRSWGAPEILAEPPTGLPPFSHNIGVEGDAEGRAVPDPLLVYGAPEPGGGDCGICWGRWDLRGGVVTAGPAR